MKKQLIENSALLVIDVQESFKAGGRWERRGNHDFEKNVAALVDAYRESSLPVIFILHTDEDAAFQQDSEYFRIMDFLTRRDDEPLLVKNTRNSFTSTSLQQRLAVLGVR